MTNASPFSPLKIQVFVDGGDPKELHHFLSKSWVSGVTTNPGLMAAQGHFDAVSFAKEIAPSLEGRSLSIAPMAADQKDFIEQATMLATLGENIFVKAPLIDKSGDVNQRMASRLINSGVGIHITCVHSTEHAVIAAELLRDAGRGFISVFAGRIADSGANPVELVREAAVITKGVEGVELVWAGARELLNVRQAAEAGAAAITVAPAILQKAPLWGTDIESLTRNAAHQFNKRYGS